jgi:hypothetical protein
MQLDSCRSKLGSQFQEPVCAERVHAGDAPLTAVILFPTNSFVYHLKGVGDQQGNNLGDEPTTCKKTRVLRIYQLINTHFSDGRDPRRTDIFFPLGVD